MRRDFLAVKKIIVIICCLPFSHCLTGYYLSQLEFGSGKTNMEEILLLGILSQNTGSETSGGGSGTDASGNESNSAGRVEVPTLSPSVGLRTSNSNITITTSTPDATIYYTTDGSTPSTSSTLYTGPIQNVWALSGKSIRAIAVRSGYEDSDLIEGLYGLPVLRTGQDECSNTGGTLIQCADTGQDGDTQPGIARSYTDNGNGTVTDNATGLVWMRCSRGQSSDASCSGEATQGNWEDARNFCEAINSLDPDRDDWRLPSRQEIETLVDHRNFGSAINMNIFPNTDTGNGYWTSTSFASDTSRAWIIQFNGGDMNFVLKSFTSQRTRCVAGASKGYNTNFVDNNNGTILDRATGLTWQKCSSGQNNNASCSGTASQINWQDSLNYCNSLSLAGRVWKMPSINELKFIVDTTKATSPTIEDSAFPSTVFTGGNYWSSTTSQTNRSAARNINFLTGNIASNGPKNTATNRYLRCVAAD